MTTQVVYHAGPNKHRMKALAGHHLLVSFAESEQVGLLQLDLIDHWDVPGWLVDSGAFATWNKGLAAQMYPKYQVGGYCSWLDRRLDRIDGYIALDVIPGEPGRPPTPDEVKAATYQTLDNLEQMINWGYRPWPVFHEGDPAWVLETYVALDLPRICLAGTVSRGKPELLDWLLPIFAQYPDVAFHGLAMTQPAILADPRLTFTSVDSTTWLNPVMNGLTQSSWLFKQMDDAFYQRMCPHLTALDATWDGEKLIAGRTERKLERHLIALGVGAVEHLAYAKESLCPNPSPS